MEKFIDVITKPLADPKLRKRIKTTMLQTPQYVGVSELENSAAPELWTPDKIEVPVLMVLAQQPMWNADYEQFARSIIPQLDYQVWENVSHFLMMEKPREFTDALVRFMHKHLLLTSSGAPSGSFDAARRHPEPRRRPRDLAPALAYRIRLTLFAQEALMSLAVPTAE